MAAAEDKISLSEIRQIVEDNARLIDRYRKVMASVQATLKNFNKLDRTDSSDQSQPDTSQVSRGNSLMSISNLSHKYPPGKNMSRNIMSTPMPR